MASILYKKYIKHKENNRPDLCEHQRAAKNTTAAVAAFDSIEPPSRSFSSAQQTEKLTTGYSGNTTDNTPCPICKEENSRMRRYRWRIVSGLCLPFIVQSLDTTIIAGALPFIASDFHQLSQLNWIVSAFNLTSAAFIPFWGQFADVFGRYAALQFSLLSMLLGSILCSATPTTAFGMLLAGRAFQGLGCAGLLIITKIVLADKVSLQENAKNNTIFTVVGGVGYGIGPIVGGYLTQVSWRWCFIINIPLGILGLIMAHFVLRHELLGPQNITNNDGTEVTTPQTFAARVATIDIPGQILFLFGMGLLVLGLTWAGSSPEYPWTSAKVLAPLIIGIILLICFVTYEYFLLPTNYLGLRSPTRKAMIPFTLLWKRNSSLLIYINFVTGMAMYAVFYFVDLYFALVQNYSSGQAGTNLIYYLPGLAAGAYLAIFCLNSWPRQTIHPLLLGTVLEPLGITLLAVAIHQNHLPMIYGMLALTGVGTGLRFMPGTLHGIAYFPSQIASIVSVMSLAISLGGTVGTTVMMNIFNNIMNNAGLNFSANSGDFEGISGLSPADQEFFRDRSRKAIELAFWGITAFLWLGVFASLGLGNVWIGKREKGEGDKQLERGSWIGWVLFGKRRGVERANADIELTGVK